jgi:Proteasome subunit
METQFKEDMSEAEAVDMIKECILAGIFNDLGSGSNCDITVIRNTGEVRYASNRYRYYSYTRTVAVKCNADVEGQPFMWYHCIYTHCLCVKRCSASFVAVAIIALLLLHTVGAECSRCIYAAACISDQTAMQQGAHLGTVT